MILVWLFWFLLLAPGAALYVRCRAAAERRSAFETIAVGYMLSFLLLAPFCVIGYALVAPLWAFGAAIVLVVAAGVADLTRLYRAGELRLQLRGEYGFALAAVVFFLIHASASGGHLANDADFHLARIRFLYDHGLSNADPLTGTGFTHPYHTNIYHALIATGSRLTGVDPIAFWMSTLPWAKLVLTSAAASLCLQLGGSILAAWLAALFVLGGLFRIEWALYPNHLAPSWLLPIGLVGCIGLFATDRPRYHALLIGGSALLLGFVHGLYAGYFALLGATAIASLTVWTLLARKRTFRSALSLAALGGVLLALPAPALYVARWSHTPTQTNYDYEGGSVEPRPKKSGRWTKQLRPDDQGRYHLKASKALGGRLELLLAIAALVALVVRKRHAEAIAVGATLGVCLVILTVPELAAAMIAKLGSAWMLERLLEVVSVEHVALVAAGLIPFALPARRPVAYALGAVPVLVAALNLVAASGGFTEESLTKVRRSLDRLRSLQVIGAELRTPMRRDQELMRRIPAGSVVLTHPLSARQIRKLHDISFIRGSRNHTGIDDLRDRTHDLAKLLHAKGPSRKTAAILAKYGIVYAIQKKDQEIKWLRNQPAIAETDSLKLIRIGKSPAPRR